MTEQRIIEIFKANVKAHIKENTPISLVDNLPVEMAFVGLKEAAQQIMKELNTKEVPEYVECVSKKLKQYSYTYKNIYPVKNQEIINNHGVCLISIDSEDFNSWFKPSTKEAYEQQEEWPKVGETYCYADPTNMNHRREEVNGFKLGMIIYHDDIYSGKERMKVVGIREDEVELEGDYSGGTLPVNQKDWMPIKGAFRLVKICEEKAKPNGCQLHNIHCRYPDCEPYEYPY